MTMRLTGTGSVLCDLCGFQFIHAPTEPVGTVRHDFYRDGKCPDAGKLYALPALAEVKPEKKGNYPFNSLEGGEK
jgi:hypothetical protein